MPNTRISLLLTSCGRHDLLETTLSSFYAVVDQHPQEVIVYEDSDQPMPEFLQGDIWRTRNVRWISGKTRMGQCFACARLIQEAQFEYVFWMEDDWLFQNQISPFMRESKVILDAHPEVVMVSLRGPSGWHPLVRSGDLWIAEPGWKGVWGGWSWNPGLRRRETLVKLLPQVLASVGLKGIEHEQILSKSLLDQGFRIADLGRPIVTHIGGNRSRSIEDLPPLPKILVAVPTCFAFDYETRWEHQGNPEYGKDMHVNGPNDQTQACRETWVGDFAPFRNVDVRFFYGLPHEKNYPRQPFADEVFLDRPDGYGSLIDKTIGVCQYAHTRGYQYVYKCDTDTWVYAERLLIEMMENAFDYAGYLHASVCSGGPGYFLSAHAAAIVANNPGWRHDYAEDVHVSRVLAEHNIRPVNLPNHTPGFSAHFFFGDGVSFDAAKLKEELVSCHAVFPDQMRKIWELKNSFQRA
jgi:hypothetical protein